MLSDVHAAIGFRQQVFGVAAIRRVEGLADAHRNQILAANRFPDFRDDFFQPPRHFCSGFLVETCGHHHEFVAAHPRRIVVFAARVFQGFGEHLQQFVSLEVSKTIVDLLESVEV